MEDHVEAKLDWFHCNRSQLDEPEVAEKLLNNRGVYIFKYRNDAGSRVSYVGKVVVNTFKHRLVEHFRFFYGCTYPLYRIDKNKDFLHFLADEILGRKVDESHLVNHQNICWYREVKSQNYFAEAFQNSVKKRANFIEDHLNCLEFSFASVSVDGQPADKSVVGYIESMIGRAIHKLYIEELSVRLNVSPNHKCLRWPNGRSDDTIVGRHSSQKASRFMSITHTNPPEEIVSLSFT